MARDDTEEMLEEGQRALDAEFERQRKAHAKARKEEQDSEGEEGYARGGLVRSAGLLPKQLSVSDGFAAHRKPSYSKTR